MLKNIRYMNKIIESLKYYCLEKAKLDSNVYIFYEKNNKILDEAFYQKIFQQINNIKLLQLLLLNIFLSIFLLTRITKIEKEKYDSLISILILTAFLFNVFIFIMIIRPFQSIKIKKKYLLYFLFGINIILAGLVSYFELQNENLEALTKSANLIKNIENSNKIRDLFDNVRNKQVLNIGNITNINIDKNVRIHKILQFNDFFEQSKNDSSYKKSIRIENDNKKNNLLLLFNITI